MLSVIDYVKSVERSTDKDDQIVDIKTIDEFTTEQKRIEPCWLLEIMDYCDIC